MKLKCQRMVGYWLIRQRREESAPLTNVNDVTVSDIIREGYDPKSYYTESD